MVRLVVFITVLVMVVVLNRAWVRLRVVRMIRVWAAEQGFDLVSAQLRGMRQGPFFLQGGRSDTVHRIVVRQRSGATRSGWVLCRNGVFALIHDRELVVEWDRADEPARTSD